MAEIKLKVIGAAGDTLSVSRTGERISLVHTAPYADGDWVALECDEPGLYCVVQLEDTMPPALVYIKERGLDLGTDIAVIGTNQDPNTEEILAQNPDFVILNAEVSEQTALHEFLQEAGVPHAYFKTNTFDEYLAMLRTFCDMTGREDLYEQNGLAVQQQITDVLELVKNAKLPAPDVLLLRAYSSGCKAKGSDNMTGAMLKDLGAINIADADDSLLENLSMENIIADDPEDIFVVTMGASQQKALDWLAENLQANPAWSGLSAVQSGHYYLLDKALFHYKPNARWGESYRTLAALLYPQLADQLEALA